MSCCIGSFSVIPLLVVFWAIQERFSVEVIFLATLWLGGLFLSVNYFRKLSNNYSRKVPKRIGISIVLAMVVPMVASRMIFEFFDTSSLNTYFIGSYYIIWASLTFLAGVPFMTFVFYKYDK